MKWCLPCGGSPDRAAAQLNNGILDTEASRAVLTRIRLGGVLQTMQVKPRDSD
jgi:hypothetical protein